MEYKVLYRIGLVCGALTLIVGSGIFILWWIARAWFAIDLYQLEGYGFLWILISIPIGLVGLITSLFAFGANLPKIWKSTSIGVLVVLINIPVLSIILDLQSDIEKRVYFKIKNKSPFELTDLKIYSKEFSFNLNDFAPEESTVGHYIPTYPNGFNDSYPTIDSVFLDANNGDGQTTFNMPYAMEGSCDRLIITDSLTMERGR